MTHLRYNPQEFAELLTKAVQHAAPHFATYKRALDLDPSEYARLLFASVLFPVSASHSIAAAEPDSPLAATISKAHEIYLGGIRNPDQLVRLGDYIIWRIERDLVCQVLHKRFNECVNPAHFASHQILYGRMAHIVSDIRKRAFLADIHNGFRLASNTEPKQGLTLGLMSVAMSFTRYILTIDPTNPLNTQATMDRYRASIGFASKIVIDVYFRLVDECKAATQA